MLFYGRLILYAANWLSDGSELLLEILNPGIIGGVISGHTIVAVITMGQGSHWHCGHYLIVPA